MAATANTAESDLGSIPISDAKAQSLYPAQKYYTGCFWTATMMGRSFIRVSPRHCVLTGRDAWPIIPTAIDAPDVSYIHYQGEKAVIRLSMPVYRLGGYLYG